MADYKAIQPFSLSLYGMKGLGGGGGAVFLIASVRAETISGLAMSDKLRN